MKHFRRRMLANGLAMALVVSSLVATPASAANNVDFKDIKGHWAESQIKSFLEKGYIEGYGDNTFKPDNKITRAEFIKIVNMAFGYTEKGTENFKDVNPEDWFYGEVLKAMKQGYIDGYGDGTFKPNEPISREEACKIVGVILKANGYGNTTFKDDAEIESWAKKYVKGLVDMGIIDGFKEDNTFRPEANTSRAETVKTIKGAIEYNPSTGGGGTVSRNIIIASSDDFNKLSGSYDKITVKGNATGEIKNITAKELVVESGDIINITNSTITNMYVKDTDNSVEIKASGATKISNVLLESGAKLSYENNITRTNASPYGKVDVKTSENVIIDANVVEVTLSVASSRVELTEKTIIDKLVVSENGAGAIIYGSGNVTNATIKSDCTISKGITIDVDNGAGIEQKEVVSNLEGLKVALAGAEGEINLAADIDGITESIEVNRQVTINGGGHTLSFTGLENAPNKVDDGLILYENATVNDLTVDAGLTDPTKWDGTYAIHVYNTEASLNNITATGGNGGILVNSSTVILGGIIDVSNNGLGGIEVSKGENLTKNSTLNIGTDNIKNESEAYALPTIWVIDGQGELEGGSFTSNNKVENGQTQYYLDTANAGQETTNVSNLKGLEKALLSSSISTINITKDIDGITESIKVNREVTINGGGHTLTFKELENITDPNKEDDGLILYKNATVNDLSVDAGLTDPTKWDGTYAIQVYGTTATLNNVKATGGNGGILVNSSTVTLGGTIDVSNNGLGGIEVSKGENLTHNSKLNIGTAYIKNESEAYALPTIWIIDGQGTLNNGNQELYHITVEVKDGNQTQYYLKSENTESSSDAK